MIDPILLDYLSSGSAWLLIGSGVSSQMGYPSWKKLAQKAMSQLKQDRIGFYMRSIEKSFQKDDFPSVFQAVYNELNDQLLCSLEDELKPKSTSNGEIYDLLAKWPIPVYLTTNWDDEIQKHLAKIQESYITYKNRASDITRLLPDLDGAIFKLHGDLTSNDGLIMTTSQYEDITNGKEWEYWRTKMTSIFQMNKMIIIGHSLTDQNVRHVLELAKNGSGFMQPICWVAPDVPMAIVKEYLEKFRIRVISYDNRNGTHQNLFRLLTTIDNFVPKRKNIRLSQSMSDALQKTDNSAKGLAGFHIFNQMFEQEDYEEKRISILLAAIQSNLPLQDKNTKIKSMADLLLLSGWPESTHLATETVLQVFDKGLKKGWFKGSVNAVEIDPCLYEIASEKNKDFEHIHQRFRTGLKLRIKRLFPNMNTESGNNIDNLIDGIDNAIISFFQHDGLTLSQCIFSDARLDSPLPASLAGFLTEASCVFDDYLSRQVFSKVTLDIFINSTDPEREYLGRISQGYFAFHTLGVFGDVAIQQLKHVTKSVWLIDSDSIIQTMALYGDTNSLFYDTFQRLTSVGGRYFITDKLADEAFWHLHYANELIEKEGESSSEIFAAAEGTLPFNKENQFLRGFINWQAMGNSCDWGKYLKEIIQESKVTKTAFQKAMIEKNFEIITFDEWPGFQKEDFVLRDTYTEKIISRKTHFYDPMDHENFDYVERVRKKAEPESEAIIIIEKERQGNYHILTENSQKSDARFISHTGVLNSISKAEHITWRTEDFLHFISSLPASAKHASQSAHDAFQFLLISFAQSGMAIIEDQVVNATFGEVANKAVATIFEQEVEYSKILNEKYGASPNELITKLDVRQQPMAAIQIANEAFQRTQEQQEHLLGKNEELAKELKEKEERLKKLSRYENKVNERAAKAKKNKRKNASKKKKRK